MKKQHLLSVLVLTLILSLPVIIHAQQDSNQNDGGDGSNPPPGQPVPPPFGGLPQSIDNQVQASYQSHLQGARDNQNYRNTLLQNGGVSPGMPPLTGEPLASSTGFGSSTPGRPPFPLGMGYGREGSSTLGRFGSSTRPFFGSTTTRFGSTTPPWFGPKTPPWMGSSTMRDYMKYMRDHASSTMDYVRGRSQRVDFDFFRVQQANLIDQLTIALTNLQNIDTRIQVKIQDEQNSGVDMTNASELLTAAESKITAASDAIQVIVNYNPATSTATTTIDLEKPRQLGDDAIKALNDAKQALNDVVRAIEQAIGASLTGTATTTASTTSE